MSRKANGNYYEDRYVKHECQSCKRCFIVGRKLSEGMRLSCPYCQSSNIEVVAASAEESARDMDMGYLGLYYSLYDGGRLMLYTEREFAAALTNCEGTPVGTAMDCITSFCEKRNSGSANNEETPLYQNK